MPIEGFDYQEFTQVLASQAFDLVPANFQEFQKNYIVNTIKNFSQLAAEALYNDDSININADQAMLITQIIAEWSFHKSVDLVKSGVMPEYWDAIMQKIAFTIFEVAKQSIAQGSTQEQILQVVEHQVKKTYQKALDELNERGIIDEQTLDKASHQSNIDEMMDQIREEKEAEAGKQSSGGTGHSDSKILKLASVALLLKQVSQDKVQTILNKFNPEDAQAVIQYMQMTDLEQKVDKDIAMKCLQEIRVNLPEPKQISSDKIISKLKNAFEKNGKEKIERILAKERPNIKEFVTNAINGESFTMSSRVANIIAQHLEEGV